MKLYLAKVEDGCLRYPRVSITDNKMCVRIPCMYMRWDPTKSVYQCFFCYFSGVMYNIRYSIPVCSFNELLQAVVKVLAQVLDVNCFDVISKLLPEPTKVKCNLLWCTHNFSWEIHAERIFSDKKVMSENTNTYNLSDRWSKDLLFDCFVSLVFCFVCPFCEKFGHYSSCTLMCKWNKFCSVENWSNHVNI